MKRIPCGLPHIPLAVLNSSTASLFCADHTLCGVSKHPRLFKSYSKAKGGPQSANPDFRLFLLMKLDSVTKSFLNDLVCQLCMAIVGAGKDRIKLSSFEQLDSAITLPSAGALAVPSLVERFPLTTSTEIRSHAVYCCRAAHLQSPNLPNTKSKGTGIWSRLRGHIQMKKWWRPCTGRQTMFAQRYLTICFAD